MYADSLLDRPDAPGIARTWLLRGLVLAGVLVLVLFAWRTFTQDDGVARKAADISTIIPLAPPPPPPPPPEEVEKPKPVEESPPVPVPNPAQNPQAPSPSPAANAAAPGAVTQNADAQTAGAGVQSGAGTGRFGSGIGGSGTSNGTGGNGAFDASAYGNYLNTVIEAALKRSRKLPGNLRAYAKGRVWVDAGGRVVRFEFDQGTGTRAYDDEIAAIIRSLSALRLPSQAVLDRQPLRFSMDHRTGI
ncbi:hypothetical protein [Sphingomonas sp. KR3-1]|uniref:hypothetical protein n=1 Tax=Sphingomonas sp. KR3-1 TaxID=3156611 RepID=UPI0032B4F4D6